MRTTFISYLQSLARNDNRIVLIVGDLGYSVVENFANEFPDRFYNAGIAEQNMAGLAAGLASEGYKVFIYSIANFPTFRAAEQIRNDIDYMNLSVTVVSVGGGLAYGSLGYSHHAVQDYGLMRLFPNMTIAAPGDPIEVKSCLNRIIKTGGPHYLRLGKAGEPNFNLVEPNLEFFALNFIKGSENSRNLVISTGAALTYASEYFDKQINEDWALCTLPIWGMKYSDDLRPILEGRKKIVSFEDHLKSSGFGSWLLEAVSTLNVQVELERKGLNPAVMGLVGSQSELNFLGGLAS